jgi:hypothetical protein
MVFASLSTKTLDLEKPGDKRGGEVTITTAVPRTPAQCVKGKSAEEAVFTCFDHKAVQIFDAWARATEFAGVFKLRFHDRAAQLPGTGAASELPKASS